MAESTATTPATPHETSGNRSAMLIVFLVVFIDLLGFGIMLPLLPRFGETYLGDLLPGGEKSKLSGVVLGLLMSSFSAMQFVFAPLWGRISDGRGRRPILLLGLCASVAFYALLGVAWEMPARLALLAVILMFVARTGAGIAGATISTAQAVIADSTPPEKRKVGMALIGAAFGIGFTFGPLIGFAALTIFPTHAGSLGFVAAGLSLVALLLGLWILPETRRPGVVTARRQFINWHGVQYVIQIPTVGLLITVFFLATFGFAQFETTLSLLNKDNLKMGGKYELTENTFDKLRDDGLPQEVIDALTPLKDTEFTDRSLFAKELSDLLSKQQLEEYQDPVLKRARRGEAANFLIFAYVGMVLMLAQGLLYRRLAHRLREETFMALGIVLMGLGVASLGGVTWLANTGETPLSNLIPLTLTSLTVAVTGFSFLTPSITALISRRSDPSRQGEVLGVNQSASALARILGPAIGLPLYKLHDSHLLPYCVGACLILVMLPLMPRIRRGSDVFHATTV